MTSASAIDNQIIHVLSEIQKVKSQREEARESYIKNQEKYAKRQFICAQKLNRKLRPRVSTISCYTRAMQNLSLLDTSPYIIVKEAALCQTLHQVEIITNQFRILSDHRKKISRTLSRTMKEEKKMDQDIQNNLNKKIQSFSVKMTNVVTENQATMELQKREMSRLGWVDYNKNEDISEGLSKDNSKMLPMVSFPPPLLRRGFENIFNLKQKGGLSVIRNLGGTINKRIMKAAKAA